VGDKDRSRKKLVATKRRMRRIWQGRPGKKIFVEHEHEKTRENWQAARKREAYLVAGPYIISLLSEHTRLAKQKTRRQGKISR